MAELLLTAGTDEEFFAIIGLTIFMVFVTYVGFEIYDKHCERKWREENEQESNPKNR